MPLIALRAYDALTSAGGSRHWQSVYLGANFDVFGVAFLFPQLLKRGRRDWDEEVMVDPEIVAAMEMRTVTKKEAAGRQIDVAIRLYEEGEYEASITLSCATEGMLISGMPQPLFDRMKDGRPREFKTEKEWATFLNDTRDWLKHCHDQGDRRIGKFEAWIMLCRGLTKYHGMFGYETDEMKAFTERARKSGLTLKQEGR